MGNPPIRVGEPEWGKGEWGWGKPLDVLLFYFFLPIDLSFLFYLSIIGSQVDVVIVQKLIFLRFINPVKHAYPYEPI